MQTDRAEPSVHAHYLYDATGQRVKKLVRKQGGQIEVTHYINAVFEHHRWGSGAQAGENNHLQVMDDKQRIALVRIGNAHPEDKGPTIQFHLVQRYIDFLVVRMRQYLQTLSLFCRNHISELHVTVH